MTALVVNHLMKNMEKEKIYKKRYNDKNPLRRKFQSKKAVCKKRGIRFELDLISFMQWYNSQLDTCYYCHNRFNGKYDAQMDRKDHTIGYTLENMVMACSFCNRYKSDIFTDLEWLEIVEKYGLAKRYIK